MYIICILRGYIRNNKIRLTRLNAMFGLPSSSSRPAMFIAAIFVSISDVDFCRRNSLDLTWHRVVTFSWQSRCTFILHTRHFRPCLVCPASRTVTRRNRDLVNRNRDGCCRAPPLRLGGVPLHLGGKKKKTSCRPEFTRTQHFYRSVRCVQGVSRGYIYSSRRRFPRILLKLKTRRRLNVYVIL